MRRVALFALALVACAAQAQFYGPKSMQDPGSGRRAVLAPQSQIGVDQKLNDYVPMDLRFTDSDGSKVVLRQFFKDKPVVLMPVFYECAGVCTLELNNMAMALGDFKKDFVGQDFIVVTFSIKPTEGPEFAQLRKDVILDIYNKRGAEEGWHFLTGSYDQIKALTDSIGFRYEYDNETGNVVHPAAAIVLTPQGQVSKYFLETEYPVGELLASIKEAAKGRIGVKVQDDSIWNCIELDPITGQKTLNIMKALNLAGLFTLVALTVAVVYMTVRYKTTALKPGDAKEDHSA
ncbi:MAG: SCO family protein [Fimbriimonadaceae bacterium]